MKALAAFVMRGPATAGAVAAGTLALGLVLPPFAWLSAAVVALVTLRQGLGQALRVAVPALAGLGIAGWLALGQGVALVLGGAATWLPSLVLAAVLRQRVRLDETLMVAGGLGWGVVAAIHALVDDPAATWREALTPIMATPAMSAQLGVPVEEIEQVVAQLAPMMTGLLGLSVALGGITSLLLARWWQALLYNPGGFGAEFRGLRLGRGVAAVVLGLCAAATTSAAAWVDALAVVAAGVYVFQGLAVVHGVVHARGLAGGWLAGLYAAMVVLLPYIAGALMVLGAVDAWMDYRRRAGAP